MLEELGLEGAKRVVTPAVKPSMSAINSDKELPEQKSTHFRALAARGNYLSADRPEIQFAAKEVCRFMATPIILSSEALKRVGRYLVMRPRLVYQYHFQDNQSTIDVYADTDHAGCLRTRKSTSGGCIMVGTHLLKSWSSTRPTVTLSSGEAELHGVIKAGANGMGMMSLLFDLGVKLYLVIWTDSTATQGICGR